MKQAGILIAAGVALTACAEQGGTVNQAAEPVTAPAPVPVKAQPTYNLNGGTMTVVTEPSPAARRTSASLDLVESKTLLDVARQATVRVANADAGPNSVINAVALPTTDVALRIEQRLLGRLGNVFSLAVKVNQVGNPGRSFPFTPEGARELSEKLSGAGLRGYALDARTEFLDVETTGGTISDPLERFSLNGRVQARLIDISNGAVLRQAVCTDKQQMGTLRDIFVAEGRPVPQSAALAAVSAPAPAPASEQPAPGEARPASETSAAALALIEKTGQAEKSQKLAETTAPSVPLPEATATEAAATEVAAASENTAPVETTAETVPAVAAPAETAPAEPATQTFAASTPAVSTPAVSTPVEQATAPTAPTAAVAATPTPQPAAAANTEAGAIAAQAVAAVTAPRSAEPAASAIPEPQPVATRVPDPVTSAPVTSTPVTSTPVTSAPASTLPVPQAATVAAATPEVTPAPVPELTQEERVQAALLQAAPSRTEIIAQQQQAATQQTFEEAPRNVPLRRTGAFAGVVQSALEETPEDQDQARRRITLQDGGVKQKARLDLASLAVAQATTPITYPAPGESGRVSDGAANRLIRKCTEELWQQIVPR